MLVIEYIMDDNNARVLGFHFEPIWETGTIYLNDMTKEEISPSKR